MINPPAYIDNLKIVGAPIKYKWNSDLALKFFAAKDQNVRLYEAVDRCNFRAKMALGIAISECAIWRFQGHADLTDALNRVEAAWASSINPAYARDLKAELTRDDDREIVDAALEMVLAVLGIIDARYRKGSIYLAEPVVRQAVLAQHLLPDKKLFTAWLSETVKRAAETFPRLSEYDEESEFYDASQEAPVPRDFFDPGYQYSQAAAAESVSKFIKALDPGRNPYLRTSEEMKAQGFAGTPYAT